MNKYKSGVAVFLFILFFTATALFSKNKEFSIIEPDKLTRYKEDRIAYQRIEKKVDLSKDDFTENYTITKDNSVENLLIVKDRKIHFISDGYEALSDIKMNKILKDSINKYVVNNDFWLNKINGKPDYIRVIYRRNDLMINANEEYVTKNFGAFFKSTRDRFIKLHVDKFRQMFNNRIESNFIITKKLLSYKLNPDNSDDIKQKFFISIKAKSTDGTVYYCEDSDGDGVTETFSVSRDDGFDWGLNSGPNIILIKSNSDKDIETQIGKLANDSVNGSTEEEQKTLQQFPSEKEVMNLMDQITPADKYYE